MVGLITQIGGMGISSRKGKALNNETLRQSLP